MKGKFTDLTGMKFERLTVIERTGTDKNGNPLWRCVCDCGNKDDIIVGSNNLKKCFKYLIAAFLPSSANSLCLLSIKSIY